MRGRLVVAAASIAAMALLSGAVAGGMRVTPVETVDGFPAEPELDYSLFTGGIAPLRAEYIADVLGRALTNEGASRAKRVVQTAGAERPARGVTRDEVRVLVYYDVGSYGDAEQGENTPGPGTYVDVDKAPLPACRPGGTYTTLWSDPNACDHALTRMVRAFARSLNARFETHGRHVHFWLYFTDADSAFERGGDAEKNARKVRPFAVIDEAVFFGFNRDYTDAAADLGVLTFSSQIWPRSREDYAAVAPHSWGYWPDSESAEELFRSYICEKVAPFPVRRFGNPSGVGAPNGLPRRFGIYYPITPPELEHFAELLIAGVKRCGVDVVARTYEESGFAVDTTNDGSDAAEATAAFQTQGVTTVIYVGVESRLTTIFDALHYYPEIVVAGDLTNDNNFLGRTQNQNVWSNAWAVTNQIRMGSLDATPGAIAFKEGSPSGSDDATGAWLAHKNYNDFLMVFTALSRAGRTLTVAAVERGLRSLPHRQSPSPFASASFFGPSDYTWVKDAAEQWWDPEGVSPGRTSPRSGCWRMVRDGRRSLAHQWSGADDVFRNAADPCTGFEGTIKIRLN